jgi:NADPH-dependent curcumin reductase CurA
MTDIDVGVRLVRRPVGRVTEDCFELVERPVPEPGPGEVVVRNIYLSIDPYLRGRMDSAFGLGEVVPVRAVGEVAASQHPRWRPGDLVWGFGGWERWSVMPAGAELWPVDPALGPISQFVSVLGMPGRTAWVGMVDLGHPRPGETVVVSAAAGAVGSLAGQLARLAGARVVGSAGSADKVAHCVDRLGYDAAFDHRRAAADGPRGLADALRQHCPAGIDVYFDNVGGPLLEAVLGQLNPFARIPVCGMISGYERTDDPGLRGLVNVLVKRATMTGFSIYDHMAGFAEWQPGMAALQAAGRIVYHEEIWEGIESVPAAFIGMLAGDNLGKRLVRVGSDPTA